jgi:Ring hydroxylating beta subunit
VRDEQGRGSNGRWRRHVTEARGPATPATAENLLLRLAVEHFLFEEAAHLDNWRLDDWLALFTEDGRYVVPTTDLPNGDGSETQPTTKLRAFSPAHLTSV